ncbi:MAG: aconitate hydratase [Acidobacteria bacterium]|nr:aconitate hydratase [Acidobacteriota bacterium]MBV9186309.1 aconitate hydratase [Acidobacteriota bacterium]
MEMPHNTFNTLDSFDLGDGRRGQFYSLPKLEAAGVGNVSKLPVSIRIVLESVLRNVDGKKIAERDVRTLANWQPRVERTDEIPFMVARVLLQDFTGVPLLVDLAAMRSAAQRAGVDPKIIEPLVPVDLVVDHSVQVDYSNRPDALQLNMDVEFKRNQQRYQFLKWGMQAFNGFGVVPPGIGIVHQVNLEYLARGVLEKDGVWYPDTLVGTDSHTTMINGLGIVAWGVGGIEAEAGMLGQPVYFLTPDVVGVHLKGSLREGVTATDLVLTITEMLRKAKVVGKFIEYFGDGAASLALADRATIANMAPEYGATMGYFPVDEETCRYMLMTGRSDAQVNALRGYFKAQGLFGMPKSGDIDYTTVLELDLNSVVASVAGPKRPQDRIELDAIQAEFQEMLKSAAPAGYGKPQSEIDRHHGKMLVGITSTGPEHTISGGGEQDSVTAPNALASEKKNTSIVTEEEMVNNRPTPDRVAADSLADEFPMAVAELHHGDVLIAAITSCTNTSNPSVMLAAGLLAKKAVEKGLRVPRVVKTSLAPGSRVVTDYYHRSGLQPYLDQLGFYTVGYGCTTCIGNSGPLDPRIEEAITQHDLIGVSVLSGNRNFEARVHQSIRANFLMSPPLVVAFALAGRIDIDMANEPIGRGAHGEDVYLREIWPTMDEIRDCMANALDAESFRTLYQNFADQNPLWNEIPTTGGLLYSWDENSTYIQEPPFFTNDKGMGKSADITGARALAIFGDSVTTDHISPAGSIKANSPAGKYLIEQGVPVEDFNSYGSRRGNDRVMTRGTFANVRIKNLMVPGVEGGVTKHQPDATQMSIYDAAMQYQNEGTPLVVIAGQEYGTGSSRDWAAKGTKLLGVRAVITQSFERIHRSNLVGMGVLPLQFEEGTNAASFHLDGTETYDITGITGDLRPRQKATLVIHRANGSTETVPLIVRIDTPIEVDYYEHGGILPFVLRQLMGATN